MWEKIKNEKPLDHALTLHLIKPGITGSFAGAVSF